MPSTVLGARNKTNHKKFRETLLSYVSLHFGVTETEQNRHFIGGSDTSQEEEN